MRTDADRTDSYRPRRALLGGAASLVTVFILIGAKTFAFWQSGSASVYASLMDSLADVTASGMSLLAIHLSLKPADKNHRSGHGKIEGLAALFQALLILGAGISLFIEAARRMAEPAPVEHVGLATVIMAFSVALSVALVAVQKWALRSAPSLALEADQAHYSMDILVNAGVIAVLFLMTAGAPPWIDPAFAVCVALYLAHTAYAIARKGLDMLLDRELPKTTREAIRSVVLAQDGVLGMHDLRTSQSGMRIFISFDIEADPNLPLIQAHAIARGVEHALLSAFPNAEIMIHVDPSGDTDDARHRPAAARP